MKKSKLLLVVSLFTVGALTACNSAKDVVDNVINNDDNKNNGDAGEVLPYTVSEARNKLKTLGQTSGFEITLHYASEDNSGEDVDDEMTIGYKSDILWIKQESAYKKTSSGGIDLYDYEYGKYVFSSSTDAVTTDVTFDVMVDTVTSMFYYAYDMTGMQYTTKSTIKFLNRDAYQYSGSYAGAGAVASFTVVIDIETGITLKVVASGATVDGESGSAAIEVTAFKTGNAVVLPELVRESSSGNGEGSGNGQGSGEGSGNGEGQGHTGTGEDGGNGDDTGSGIGESGDPTGEEHGQGGDTEDLSKYLVTAEQYKAIVTDMAYITPAYNLKVDWVQKDNLATSKPSIFSGTFENDNGTYLLQDVNHQANPETVTRIVYAPNTEHEGTFDVYRQVNNGEWEKGKQPLQLSDYLLAREIGLDVASLISLNSLNEPAYASSPYYFKSELKVTDESEAEYTLNNVRMYFENGKLVKFTYVMAGTLYEYNYIEFGHVDVQVPSVQPEEQAVKHNELLSGTNGATFVYNRIDLGGYSGDEFEDAVEALQYTKFKFFADGSIETYYSHQNIEVVNIGTYSLMKKASENTAAVTFKTTTRYVNGVENTNNSTEDLTYYAQEDELHLIQTGHKGDGTPIEVHIILTRSQEVPTHYEVPAPEASKWLASDIAAALKTLELKASVPEISKADCLAKDVTVQIVDGTLQITCEFDTADNAAVANYSYYSVLTSDKNGYKLDYVNSNYDNGVLVYLSSDNLVKLTTTYVEGSKVITIVVEEAPVSSYPTNDIAAWLKENAVTDKVIEFLVENASYSFSGGFLTITLPDSADVDAIIEGFADALVEDNDYTVDNSTGVEIYIGPNRTIGLVFMKEGPLFGIGFVESTSLPQELSSQYPETQINAFLASKKITDSVPNFVVENAQYVFVGQAGEDGEWPENVTVAIKLPENADAETILEGLEGLLTGYGNGEFEHEFVSENKQVGVEFAVEEGYIYVTLFEIEPADATFTFTVNYYVENTDEKVLYLVGDFCDWDPNNENAIELSYDEESHIWTGYFYGKVGDSIHCKLVVVNARGAVERWEKEGKDNERVIILNSEEVEEELVWGYYD